MITWSNERRKLKDLQPWTRNPRQIKRDQAKRLAESFEEFGQVETIAIGPNNEIYNGHQRLVVLMEKHGGEYEVEVRVSSRPLTEKEREKLTVYLHKGAAGVWDFDTLANEFEFEELVEWGFSKEELTGLDFGQAEPVEDAGAQVDRAEELREKWQVEPGQLWALGDHRLICGDCTDAAVVARVMGGEKAILICADPPYGMGKEKDGIENDNLYRDKLDEFQMLWWNTARKHVNDNGSAYIWGTDEDLFRLWFLHLKDSERLTFRNEIVWDKGSGQGMLSPNHRMYPTASERCLFFVIGEQGYNNNADNYWEGFEPIRAYLDGERKKMGWDIPTVKKLVGHSDLSGDHWFSISQWEIPTKKVYEKLQAAANGDAFRREYDDLRREYDDLRREYDDLRREFYASRAPFDNTHEPMTDVWHHPVLSGEDRPDHPTPKPVALIERIIKTSGKDDAPIYSPFVGSGTDIMAGEGCGRRVYGCEISPAYVAVTLERWAASTGRTPELLDV